MRDMSSQNNEKHFKPPSYPTVSIYIMARGAQAVIDFSKNVFDAEQLFRLDRPDGLIRHAEIRIDDSVLMIADETPRSPSFPVWIHVYVPHVDVTYQRALSAGGVSVQAPSQGDRDPDRRAGVKDPSGNTWWIGTRITQ